MQSGTTDLAALEEHKENIQPLASGRSAKHLHNILTSDKKSLDADLHKHHAAFNAEIQEVEDGDSDDPLDVYHRYIRWTLASYPSGSSHTSQLVPLLERTTRRFLHSEQYKNDIRLLKLWILYAKYVKEPKDIYRFLFTNDLGTNLASFYEEWAALEEASGNYKDADKLYDLGTARRAQPLDRLKKRRDAFRARMLLPQAAQQQAAYNASIAATTSSQPPVRSILGSSTGGSAGILASSSAGPSKNGAAFAIFKDTEDSASKLPLQDATWADLGTNKSRTRENTKEAGPWKGETIPQNTVLTASVSGGMRIEVFRDDDAPLSASVSGAKDALAKSIGSSDIAEILRRDPFHLYRSTMNVVLASLEETLPTGPAVKSITSTKSSSSTKLQKASVSKEANTSVASDPKQNGVAVPLESIYPQGYSGSEFSFEEIRAQKLGLRNLEGKAQYQLEEWESEATKTGKPYRINAKSRKPILYHEKSGEPLFKYLRPAWEQEQAKLTTERKSKEAQQRQVDEQRKADELRQQEEQRRKAVEEVERERRKRKEEMAKQEAAERAAKEQAIREAAARKAEEQRILELQQRKEAEQRRLEEQAAEDERRKLEQERLEDEQRRQEDELRQQSQDRVVPVPQSPDNYSQYRPGGVASPTINTKAALAEVDAMFNKTLNFGPISDRRDSTSSIDSSTASTSDEEDVADIPQSQSQGYDDADDTFWGQSQSQQSQGGSQIPASSQQSVFTDTDDDSTDDAEQVPLSQSSSSSSSGTSLASTSHAPFKPIKPGPRIPVFQDENSAPQPPKASFSVFSDSVVPVTDQPQPHKTPSHSSAGFNMGRRPPGENRFAPMTDVMTPISERTYEFTSMSGYGSRRATLASQFEDDEDEDQVDEPLRASQASNVSPPLGSQTGTLSDEGSTTLTPTNPSFRSLSQSHPSSLQQSVTELAISKIIPINPFEDSVIDRFTAAASVFSQDELSDLRAHTANNLEALQKAAKAKGRRSSTSNRGNADDSSWELTLGNDQFLVRSKLGEGGFGAVFHVARAITADDDDNDEDDGKRELAVKCQKPASVWEFHILNEVRSMVDERTRQSLISTHHHYLYKDESFLLLDYINQGTLLGAVNNAKTAGVSPPLAGEGTGMEEVLAMFFTIELCRTIEALHSQGFIHGDLKIDNCLLRLEDVAGGPRAWSSNYQRSGEGGWSFKGIKLIDFGRTIATSQFPVGQTFVGDWDVDEHDCIELREHRPWTFEPDYYGLAGIAHVMLFGKYMETAKNEDGKWGITQALRRYHQAELWQPFFDAMLNPKQDGASLPITSRLGELRRSMEDWLEGNSDKGGKNLRGLLKKLTIWALT